MITITGIALDFEKMDQSQWILYFTSGLYEAPGVMKNVEPAVINLTKEDYSENNLDVFNVYYEPTRGVYNIILSDPEVEDPNFCPDYGVHLGGYMIADCNLKFMYPESKDVCYVRPYSDAFNDGYIDESSSCVISEDELICRSFNLDFSFDYLVDNCPTEPVIPGVKEFSNTEFSLTEIATI